MTLELSKYETGKLKLRTEPDGERSLGRSWPNKAVEPMKKKKKKKKKNIYQYYFKFPTKCSLLSFEISVSFVILAALSSRKH